MNNLNSASLKLTFDDIQEEFSIFKLNNLTVQKNRKQSDELMIIRSVELRLVGGTRHDRRKKRGKSESCSKGKQRTIVRRLKKL